MKLMNDTINTETWLAWFGATLVAVIGAISIAITFAYAQFETKEHSKEIKADVVVRLDRIESKLDTIGAFQQGRASDGKKGE